MNGISFAVSVGYAIINTIAFVKNGEGNFRVQKALSKTRGTILLSMNYLYDTGMIQSTTDHAVFNKQKWTGGVNVFLGKASVYQIII